MGLDETTRFFKRLVHHLSPRGQFVEHSTSIKDVDAPCIFRQPVIFLRKRTLGFNTAIESVLEDLNQRDQFPYALASLVGVTQQQDSMQQNGQHRMSLSPNGEDEEILLSKPANAEQLEIAQRLQQFGAVLVQGPPGTGKTHTIANLLGHFLAEGKSVLVTSHTSKALRVLHEKIVPPLQPLCVSMLDDDNRKQMERAIEEIVHRLSLENENRLEREASLLDCQRRDIIRQIRKDREELKLARNSEYEAIVVDGERYMPSDAAKYIRDHAEDDWIQDPISLETPIPLSPQEFVHLYRTNRTVSIQDEHEMIQGIPDIQYLLSPAEFAQCVQEITQLQSGQSQLERTGLTYRQDLWHEMSQTQTPEQFLEQFKDLQHKLKAALEFLDDKVPWKLVTIQAGLEGGMRRQPWEELVAKIEVTYTLALNVASPLLNYDPFVPEDCLPGRVEQVLSEIISFFEKGKKLHSMALLMHQDWKTLIQMTRVNGHTPESKEHFEALAALVRLRMARKDLVGRWQRQITPLGAPDSVALGETPELICKQYVYQILQCLNWYNTTWVHLENQLKQHGLLYEKLLAELPVTLSEDGQILRLRTAVHDHLPALLLAERNRREYRANEVKLCELNNKLLRLTHMTQSTPLIRRIQIAIDNRNLTAYKEGYDHIVGLYECQKEQRYRHTLISQLEKSVPAWAASIRSRDGIHGEGVVPARIGIAWRCKQLKDELDRRARISLGDVQDRLAKLHTALYEVTAELVEKKAWAAQIRRTTLEQQRALQSWKELMRKVGKGGGKRVPQLRAEARELMPICQSAVPVWIMPLNLVVQNFDPRKNHFDVIIIDEASQADIKALTAIYMGTQVIIVGDDEQVTPLAIGQGLDHIDKLIHEHLQHIPSKALYDGKLSIYALAKTTFKLVCLREHFRCVSPIIQFSNNLSYNQKIIPLRDDSEVKVQPATIEYAVASSGLRGYINEEEAITLASLVVAASEQEEYRDATMGVISMAKEDQALYIDTLLRKHLTETEYVNRRILCGTAAHFQGDERDVMFLSMVDTPQGGGPLSMHDEDSHDYMYKKRFNVAASRARDQMWVIHSLDCDRHLKNGDIRQKLILHARNPGAFINKLAEQEQKADSEFEKQVLKRLMQAGYCVTAQWPVGAYRIDLVVEGNNKRLAVECDGDRWHPIEKLEEDMARQAILERLGWRFVRIRGSQFFRDPVTAMEPVFARLQALEIFPERDRVEEDSVGQDGQELKHRVIRRAKELRQLWMASTLQPLEPQTISAGTSSTKSKISLPYKARAEQATTSGTKERSVSPVGVVSHTQTFDLVSFLKSKGLEIIDLRSQGGSLWVIGGKELLPIMAKLIDRGITCRHAVSGGRVTRHREAWCLN